MERERPVFANVSFSVKGAAEATGLSEKSIRIAVKMNYLPARYYGSKTLILANDLYNWVDDLPDVKRT